MKLSVLLRARPMLYLDEPWYDGAYNALALRRYEAGDVERLELREDFAAAWDAAGHQLPTGLRWTVTFRGQPIAVGGLEPLRPGATADGVWGAWGLAADLDLRAWAFVRRAAAKVLAFAERELKVREVHAQACETHAALALLERLGFRRAREAWTGDDGARYVPMLRSF